MEAGGRGSWRLVAGEYGWRGVHIWLSLVGPQLEAGSKIREGSGYSPSTGHFVSTVIGVIVWLAGPLARDSGLTSL